jgi:pimeloyl-ACP methyl ester carboxylesterase
MTQITHHDADLGDVRLHYVTAGSGEPIVLLHGWPETSYQWRLVIPALAERYRVIAPDLRGLGDSSTPVSGYDKVSIANDIYRLLHDVLGYESWYLGGYSWGAIVAYTLAAAHPDAVRRLAIIGVAPPREGLEFKEWWHLLNQVPDLPEALIQGRERHYFGWFYRSFAHTSFVMPDEVLDEYMRTYSQPEHLRAALEYYRTLPQDMAHFNALARTFKLPMPVLAVTHEGPINITPNEKAVTNWVAESMRPLAHDVSEVMLANTGYLYHEEKPELLAHVLATFFEGSTLNRIVG